MHSTGGIGPLQADPLKRLAQDPAVERRVVRDHHAASQRRSSGGSTVLERGRAVDHRLGDPGKALDPAAQRRDRAHQRVPAVVKLAAADEDGADLGQLAVIAGEAVGLGVDDQELGGRDRFVQQLQGDA